MTKQILIGIFRVLLALSIMTTGSAVAEDVRMYTGVVQEVSESRIQLLQSSGSIIAIGFLCEPDICKSTRLHAEGDVIIASFGSVDGKNKLLSMRKCLPKDQECRQVKIDYKKHVKQRKREANKVAIREIKCGYRMRSDLKKDSRHIGESWVSPLFTLKNETEHEFEEMRKKPEENKCINSILTEHREAYIESCKKYQCGDRVGGGCEHMAANLLSYTLLRHAVDQCSK